MDMASDDESDSFQVSIYYNWTQKPKIRKDSWIFPLQQSNRYPCHQYILRRSQLSWCGYNVDPTAWLVSQMEIETQQFPQDIRSLVETSRWGFFPKMVLAPCLDLAILQGWVSATLTLLENVGIFKNINQPSKLKIKPFSKGYLLRNLGSRTVWGN
jgi:hypothetical protein